MLNMPSENRRIAHNRLINMNNPKTRAQQIAETAGDKLIALGQMPRPTRKAQPDKETPSQIEKRRLLKAKLRSFTQD